jgi:hypothetical protein
LEPAAEPEPASESASEQEPAFQNNLCVFFCGLS